MKKVIIFLITVQCSVFSVHLANAQQDHIELSPLSNASYSNNPESDSLNLQFSFPTIAFVGEYGVETDGTSLYVTQWLGDSLAKYDQDGNVIETFVLTGVSKLRDLAWDGQYYYGSPNNFHFYILDLDNKLVLDTVFTSFRIRGMAYDPGEDVLWASEHWDPSFYKMDKQGNVIDSWIPSGITLDAISGLAYDNFSPGGPFLWGFSQDSTGAIIVKYDITNQTQTGNMIDVANLVTEPAYAGGLFIHQMEQRDVPTIGGMIQNQLVFSLELDYANMLVGIQDKGLVELMEVFPNPATDVIKIRYQIPDAGSRIPVTRHASRVTSIGLFAIDGTKIWETVPQGHDTEVEIDVSTIPAGIYFVKFQTGNSFITNKVIIQH
jgi:hypothetical protein